MKIRASKISILNTWEAVIKGAEISLPSYSVYLFQHTVIWFKYTYISQNLISVYVCQYDNSLLIIQPDSEAMKLINNCNWRHLLPTELQLWRRGRKADFQEELDQTTYQSFEVRCLTSGLHAVLSLTVNYLYQCDLKMCISCNACTVYETVLNYFWHLQ